jgi:tetratricopeptide (TPR) repeat protein
VVIPVIFMVLNYRVSDQSRNYTAYEHALNIFRTVGPGGTLLVDGDNNFFPLIYGRLVERMGESVTLYDRLNLVFRWPPEASDFGGSWESGRTAMEKEAILRAGTGDVFYAVFDPASVVTPSSYRLIPFGILQKVVREKDLLKPYRITNLWRYYAEESFYGDYYRDFMARQINGYFRLAYAQHLFAGGNIEAGQRVVAEASEIAFDDYGVHLAASTILIDENLLDAAKSEIEKASLYRGDEAIINNDWGCYYFKRGDTERAVKFFGKAIKIGGPRPVFENNLKLALDKAGRKTEAAQVGEEKKEILPWACDDGHVQEPSR